MKGRWVIIFLLILTTNSWTAGALDLSLIETRHFAIRFGEGLPPELTRDASATFEAAYAEMERTLGEIDDRPIDVVIFAETGDFTSETGLPVWSASAVIDGAIYMQPVGVLYARGVLDTSIRHEVCLVFLLRRYGEDVPAWLAEGLAVYHSGEIESVRRGITGKRPFAPTPEGIDALLLNRTDREKNRWGYVLAYEAVRAMIVGGPKAYARKKGAP